MSNFLKKYTMQIIRESVLRFTMKKTRLLGQLEALVSMRPWIPDITYHEAVSKVVRKIEKLNKKVGISEEIIASGVSFLKIQCKS